MSRSVKLSTPLTVEDCRKLKIGDQVYLSGVIYTARDVAHKFLTESPKNKKLPFCLKNAVIFHCGPVVKKKGAGFEMVAAGPTTSIREEPYEAAMMDRYGVRGIIGKGGMGEKTLAALKKHSAVYLSAVGGTAVLLAKAVKKVRQVYFLQEWGVPEAIWELEVQDFPVMVTMDSHGQSLHQKIEANSAKKRRALLK